MASHEWSQSDIHLPKDRREKHASRDAQGTSGFSLRFFLNAQLNMAKEMAMNGLIYLIGLIVVIMAILSFFGLR
jgi:hypothetical protein